MLFHEIITSYYAYVIFLYIMWFKNLRRVDILGEYYCVLSLIEITLEIELYSASSRIEFDIKIKVEQTCS